MKCLLNFFLVTAGAAIAVPAAARSGDYATHPPMRPLPVASHRPMTDAPARFVDARHGDDGGPGSKQRPWKTIGRALKSLKAGEVLYLRGGTYYEAVRISLKGRADAPITIRSFPGELAVIDAGFREFFETPQAAWEPYPDGADGEYRSTKAYRRGGNFGNFGDSMVPFQRYLTFGDLRSKNELWHKGLSNRADDPAGIYAGPGVKRDPQTGRIHIRLAHTRLAGLGSHHYRGQRDPRKLPLVIAGADYGLAIDGAAHLRIQDVVVRGAARSAVSIRHSSHVELDGVTLYGSGSALRTAGARGLKLIRSRLRGHAAPWHSRSHHKDRAGAGYLVVLDGRDFELAYCELTDHHDGVWMADAETLKFHHNLVDNFNDDGLEPGPQQTSHRLLIYQNRITRCLNTFTAHGSPKPLETAPGSGVYVFRNVVDLRRGVYKAPPTQPDPTGAFLNRIGTIPHDHGGPTWPVYYVYHNTFILPADSWRDYYLFGWGSHMRGTKRRVHNNIFVQIEGVPGLNFHALSPADDFEAGGNLLWGMREGPEHTEAFFESFRRTEKFRESEKLHPPGWTAGDIFADPQFAAFDPDGDAPADVRLRNGSPAVNAGEILPKNWPDPLRGVDRGNPDIGALPVGAGPLRPGPQAAEGRILHNSGDDCRLQSRAERLTVKVSPFLSRIYPRFSHPFSSRVVDAE